MAQTKVGKPAAKKEAKPAAANVSSNGDHLSSFLPPSHRKTTDAKKAK